MSSPLDFKQLFAIENVQDTGLEPLPIFHTTNEDGFFGMLSDGFMQPCDCPIFKEQLVFFFYGKPFYRPKYAGDVFDTSSLPVVLMFRRIVEKTRFRRLMPFDSGGYPLYELSLDPKHFAIVNNDIADILKLLKVLYTDNNQYLNSQLQLTVDPTKYKLFRPLHLIQRLYDRIKQGMRLKYGKRAFTFELTVDNRVDFNEFQVEAVVIPVTLMDEASVETIKRQLGPQVEFIPYDPLKDAPTSEEYYERIKSEVADQIIKKIKNEQDGKANQ